MKFEYYTFRMANQAIDTDENELKQVISAGNLTLICTLHFDLDEASDTYKKWICCLDVVSDTEDIPERSFTLYPNTVHFDGDTLYVVSISSELDSIGHEDLQSVFITIGVPINE